MHPVQAARTMIQRIRCGIRASVEREAPVCSIGVSGLGLERVPLRPGEPNEQAEQHWLWPGLALCVEGYEDHFVI